MALCLSFSYNPFAGLVCDCCGGSSDRRDGIQRKSFSDHRLKKHKDHDLEVDVQVNRVFMQGSTLAELHHSLPQDSDRFDFYMKFWSTDFHSIFWCNAANCNKGFVEKKNSHRGHSAQLVPINVRRLLSVKQSKVFLRETHQNLAEMQRLFSKSYNTALASPRIQAAADENIHLEARRAALNALRAQAESALPANHPLAAGDTTSANTSLAPFAPIIPFKRLVVPDCLANVKRGDRVFNFLPSGYCEASRMFQFTQLAAGDGGHIILLRFLQDSGLVGLANRNFNGEFYRMANYLIAGRSLPNQTKDWELKLFQATSEMFQKSVRQIPSIAIESRQKIMRMGDGEPGTLVSKVKGIVESAASELSAVIRHEADDDADDDGLAFAGNRDEWSHTQGKALLAQLTELVDSTSASGQKRKLDILGSDTLNRYRGTFQRFVLFVARFLDAQVGGWWHTEAKRTLQNGNDDAASTVALKLVIASLRLDEQRSYETLVEPATSIPALFILAETIQQPSDIEENGPADYPLLRSASPYNMHQACSRLLYGIRVSFLAGMVHAHLTGDKTLQDLLPRAGALSTCQAIMEIGNLARVGKSYEGEVQTGNPSPIPIVNSDGVTEEWTVQHKNKGLVYSIKKPQIALGIRRIFEKVEKSFIKIITRFFSELCPAQKRILAVCLALEDGWNSDDTCKELIKAMFTGPIAFKEAGEAGFKCHETFVSGTEIFASTIGATMQLHKKSICCGALANLLDSLADDILICILTLLSMTGRGNPRTADLSAVRCGATNAFSVNQTQLDIVIGTSGDTALQSLLIRYRSWKWNGKSSFNDCPVLWLPEELVRHLGLYLSVIRTAQVRVLSQLAEDSLTEFDFGSKRDDFVSESVTHPMLFAACTRLAFKIRLSDSQVICKLYTGFDKKVQLERESSIGLVEGSMPCSIWRLLQSGISSVIFASTINTATSPLIAEAFSHSSRTHDFVYLKTSSLETGGKKISQPMIEQGLILDTLANIWYGTAGEGGRNGNTVWNVEGRYFLLLNQRGAENLRKKRRILSPGVENKS
jgi:hypothetical protein